MNASILQFLLGVVFISLIYLNLTKKNVGVVWAYAIESLAIVAILLNSLFETKNALLLGVVLLTFFVKVIIAPIFFFNLINKYKLNLSVSSYLNTPITLTVIAFLTAIAYSNKLLPLTSIVPENRFLLALALAAALLSLFLVVNQKGALSQAVGVLSLENSIVAFAVFAGLEQTPTLQFGIIFDIAAWLVIASVFVSMIYRHFGSLDTSLMKTLKD